MSETAQTLIKAALRCINAIATGETPTAAELDDGLEALQIMLRQWSGENVMIYYQDQDTLTMDGSTYYTVGSGGDLNVTWPAEIIGAVVDSERVMKIIDGDRYRRLALSSLTHDADYIWYNPEYPLGKLYPWPTGGSSMVIDSLKPLSEPSAITSTISFPPPYDAAIKWNLAVELAPEYGKEASMTVLRKAERSYSLVQTKNFASQIAASPIELIRLDGIYNIDEG